MDPDNFAPKEEGIHDSSHPVTWLRVQLLAEHARALRYDEAACYVERQWQAVAEGLGVREDYHGYYDATVREALHATLEDMLVEVDSRSCPSAEAAGGGWCRDDHPPVQILNWAWQMHIPDPEHYPEWERSVLAEMFD